MRSLFGWVRWGDVGNALAFFAEFDSPSVVAKLLTRPMDTAIAVLAVVVLIGVGLSVLLSQSGRRKCGNPACGRVRVPGRTVCPFCNEPYDRRSPPVSTQSSPPPSGPPQYELRFVSGPKAGAKQPVAVSNLSIGRTPSNNLVLDGLLISRNHAQIVYENGRFVLYDRDSTNGTYVNDQRIAAHPLCSGDRIQIGPHVMGFSLVGQDSRAAAAPQPARSSPVPSAAPQNRGEIEDYILTPCHSGGFATVYKGVSRYDPKSILAVKVLNQTDPYARDKFLQEGYLGRVLNHPNIVQVLGTGTIDGALYIMMEFVEGGTLRERLAPGRPMPLSAVVGISTQVCAALQYAHDRKVVHRDIKPENIMFTSGGSLKIVDFGIARWATQQTVTSIGVILGTPWYLSTEQAKGLPVDNRTDLYSFGVVLYEMLTGQVPFDGDAIAVMHQHATKPPQPLRSLNHQVPIEVENVVLRSLAKDRNQRFSTATQLSVALQEAARIKPSARLVRASTSSHTANVQGSMLVVISGGGARKSIPVGAKEVILGRDLMDPDDDRLSRRHARIILQGSQYWIEDLKSTNGTFVNGVRVFQPVLLRPGSEINMGRQVLRFEG